MTKNRTVIFSATVTPPITIGMKLKFASMTESGLDCTDEKDLERHIVIVDREDKGGYKGIYTGGITECIAVTILERNAASDIKSILMIHFAGGINQDRLDTLNQFLSKRSLGKDGYRELIFTLGMMESEELVKKWFETHIIDEKGIGGLENYFLQHPESFVRSCLYSYTKGLNSACVTLDGYAGQFYGYPVAMVIKPGKGDYIQEKCDLDKEKNEFERLKEHFEQQTTQKQEQILEVEKAIENAIGSPSTKAELYFLTRELIFNKEFNKSTSFRYDVQLRQYQEKVSKLPLYSSKAAIFTTITSLMAIGLFTSLPYFFYKRKQREKALVTHIDKILSRKNM